MGEHYIKHLLWFFLIPNFSALGTVVLNVGGAIHQVGVKIENSSWNVWVRQEDIAWFSEFECVLQLVNHFYTEVFHFLVQKTMLRDKTGIGQAFSSLKYVCPDNITHYEITYEITLLDNICKCTSIQFPNPVQVKWETIDKFPRSRLQQLRFATTEGELWSGILKKGKTFVNWIQFNKTKPTNQSSFFFFLLFFCHWKGKLLFKTENGNGQHCCLPICRYLTNRISQHDPWFFFETETRCLV